MPNLSSIFSFKRENPLAGLMLFAALVLVIEAALALMPPKSLVTAIGEIPLPRKSPDWQVMGDSVAQGGIVAPQLATELGASVTNLAVAATGPEFPYFLLKRELAAGVPPRAILYSPSPHTFGTRRIALLVGAYATWPEIAEIFGAGIEPFEVFYGVTCKLSYSLRHREQLAEVLKGRRAPEAVVHASKKSADTASDADRFPAKNLHPMFKKPFEVNAFNLHFFRKFLAEAAAQKIPVSWVSVPMMEVIRAARKPLHFEEDYQQFLREVRDEFSVRLLMPESVIMGPREYKDYAHLNAEGAATFTTTVSRALRAP